MATQADLREAILAAATPGEIASLIQSAERA
jgi:hypothetical protein